jgi:hydrogenase expression/formation protein HypC
MCLGVPGKIIEIYNNDTLRMGKIDYGGVVKDACLAYVPDAKVGDYVIIHVGFALNILSPEEAEETLRTFRQLDEYNRSS